MLFYFFYYNIQKMYRYNNNKPLIHLIKNFKHMQMLQKNNLIKTAVFILFLIFLISSTKIYTLIIKYLFI